MANGKLPKVAIVGRTNVGKSTLFNALIGRRLSIVEDTAGVTRDRHYQTIHRNEATYTLVDTGGLLGGEDEHEELQAAVRAQAEVAIEECDVMVAVFDGLHGVHPLDKDVVLMLQRTKKPIIWVINKCEKEVIALQAAEFYQLSIDEFLTVSAAHRGGIQQLGAKIAEALGDRGRDISEEDARGDAPAEVIKIAVIGKPNVGKSTMINKIVGEERVIAASLPGTTTDSTDVPLSRDGQKYLLVDTAGLRRKNKIDDHTVERYGNLRTLRALARCDVGVLVLDATEGMPTEQDAKIAGLIHERGKGLIIVVNKWDLVEKDHRTVKNYKDTIQEVFKFAKYAPILFVSALSGRRCPSVVDTAKEVFQASHTRVATSELNRILTRALQHRPPPVYRGDPIRLFFSTQIGVAPPTFVLFLNHPKKLGYSYQRFLKNSLRKEYAFVGCDLKFELRKRLNKEERELAEAR